MLMSIGVVSRECARNGIQRRDRHRSFDSAEFLIAKTLEGHGALRLDQREIIEFAISLCDLLVRRQALVSTADTECVLAFGFGNERGDLSAGFGFKSQGFEATEFFNIRF